MGCGDCHFSRTVFTWGEKFLFRDKCLQNRLRYGIIGIVVAFRRAGISELGEVEGLPGVCLLVRLFLRFCGRNSPEGR